jgi:hypothetical protein
VHVDWGGRELVIRQTGAIPPAEGTTAYLSIDPAHCVLLEAGEQYRLRGSPAGAEARAGRPADRVVFIGHYIASRRSRRRPPSDRER